VALPDWLRDTPPASIAWMLEAVLALQDGAEQVAARVKIFEAGWLGFR
jgi:hypothetical protein